MKHHYEVIIGIYELDEQDNIVDMLVTTILHTTSSKVEAEVVRKAIVDMFNKAKGSLLPLIEERRKHGSSW